MCSDGVQHPPPPKKRMGGEKSSRQTSPSLFCLFFCLLPTGQLDCWFKLDGESLGGIQFLPPLFISRGSNDGAAILRVDRRAGEGGAGRGGLCPANRGEHQLAGKLTTNTYAFWPRGFSGSLEPNAEQITEKEFFKKQEEIITSTDMQGEVTYMLENNGTLQSILLLLVSHCI